MRGKINFFAVLPFQSPPWKWFKSGMQMMKTFTKNFTLFLATIAMAGSAFANTETCFFSDDLALDPNAGPQEITDKAQSYLKDAKAGEGIGWYRQGRVFYFGRTGSRDYSRAALCFESAVGNGYPEANYLLGLSYMRTSKGKLALTAMEAAMEGGNEKAELQIAYGHILKKFGTASRAETGFEMLQKFADAGEHRAMYLVANAKSTGTGTGLDIKSGFAEMLALANDGYPPAMNQVGRAYTYGYGTDKDIDLALDWYQKAIDRDYLKAELGLANTHARAHNYEEALQAYDRAIAADVDNADFELARAHSEGRFGRKSKYAQGWQTLTDLSDAGHLRASQSILDKLGDGSGRSADIGFLVKQLKAASEDGDGRSAAVLAKFLRERPDLFANATSEREEIIRRFGANMDRAQLVPELLRDTAKAHPSRAWSTMYRLLNAERGDAFIAGLIEMRRISRNAYVFALQKELIRSGALKGKATGVFNRSTVKATFKLCEAVEAAKKCANAPLSFDSVRAIANALAQSRDAGE